MPKPLDHKLRIKGRRYVTQTEGGSWWFTSWGYSWVWQLTSPELARDNIKTGAKQLPI